MPPDEIGYRLLRVAGQLNRWAGSRTDYAVPPAQLRLLALVDQLGPSRITHLAKADHCSQPTMTKQVTRLTEAGWLTRAGDPGDARAQLIDLTPAGRRMLDDARASRAASVQPLLDRLDAATRADLAAATAALEALLDRLDPTEPHNPGDSR